MSTPDLAPRDPSRLSRRQLLKASGLTLGALAAGRLAQAQAPKAGGTFVSARTTEATGLDPQLVAAFSRSARSARSSSSRTLAARPSASATSKRARA
jgi:hypothetical protein